MNLLHFYLLYFIFYISFILILRSECHGEFELAIAHNGDIHARYDLVTRYLKVCYEQDRPNCVGGFARTVTKVNELRTRSQKGELPPLLVFNSGGTLHSSPWSHIYKAEIAAKLMNILNPDAVAIGANDFCYGSKYLIEYVKSLKSPVLAANAELFKLTKGVNINKSRIMYKQSKTIGIIGFVDRNSIQPLEPEAIEIVDEIPAIRAEVSELLNKGADIIIALGSSGYAKSQQIAREIPEIDIVVGGGDETFLYNGVPPDIEQPVGPYPTLIETHTKVIPVVHAYINMKYLGYLKVKFNERDEPIEAKGQPIFMDSSIKEDRQVMDIIEPKRENVTKFAQEVLAYTRVIIDGRNSVCYKRECNFGNLAADAYVEHVLENHTSENWALAPIGLVLAGTFQGIVNVTESDGKMTRGDVVTMTPFANVLSSCSVSGETLMKTLEISVATYGTSALGRGFFQVTGMKITYDMTKEPFNRVAEVKIRCIKCIVPRYEDFDRNAIYNIVVSSILLDGALEQKYLARDHFNRFDIKESGADVSRRYMRRRNVLYPHIEGRITVITEKKSVASYIHLKYSSVRIFILFGISFVLKLPVLFDDS